MLSRASYLLLVLLSGPFALHELANRASQSKTLARTSSEEVSLAPPPIQAPVGSVQQSSPGQQQSPSATLSLPLNFQRHTGDLDGMGVASWRPDGGRVAARDFGGHRVSPWFIVRARLALRFG